MQTLPPVTEVPSVSADASIPSGYGVVRFRIPVPGRIASRSPHHLVPAYVSTATEKAVAIVRGANAATSKMEKFPCKAVCTGKIVAPLGVDLVTLQLEDKKNRVLSRGSATILVFQKRNNVFDFTLDGVPESVSVVPESKFLPVVPASSGNVIFEARDADGKIVTPDGHFTDANGNPLVFAIKANNAALHLSVSNVSAPTTPIAFSYNGSLHLGTIVVTPRARRGIQTSVAFHAATIQLVPGIANRIPPPIPVTLMTATQVPIPTSSTACGGNPCFEPNAIFLLGNAGGQSTTLRFDVTDGAYGLDETNAADGPFANPPVEYVTGFYAFMNTLGNVSTEEDGGSVIAYSLNFANPCPGTSPIGYSSTGTLYCTNPGLLTGSSIYDQTHGATVALGQDRKIQEINGTTYFATVAHATPGPNQQVTASGSLTPISGAISVGASITSPTTVYFGDSDGTVKQGTTTVATFSNPVENVVGDGTSIYVYESNGAFGVSANGGTFESLPLPIGTVLEVVTGVNGAPMLVETDGTLDVMGI
jgi:hypothetical protein